MEILCEFDFATVLSKDINKNQVFNGFRCVYQDKFYAANEKFLKNSLLLVETKIRLLDNDDSKASFECKISEAIKEARTKLYQKYFVPLLSANIGSKIVDEKKKELPKIYIVFVANGKDPKKTIAIFQSFSDFIGDGSKKKTYMMAFFDYVAKKIKISESKKEFWKQYLSDLWNNVEVAVFWISQDEMHKLAELEAKEKDKLAKEDEKNQIIKKMEEKFKKVFGEEEVIAVLKTIKEEEEIKKN